VSHLKSILQSITAQMHPYESDASEWPTLAPNSFVAILRVKTSPLGTLTLNLINHALSQSLIMIMMIIAIRGGIKKKKTGFFQKNSERGGEGSRRIRNFLIRKNSDFLEFFYEGGGVSPIPKGCYHKKTGDFGLFLPKRGVSPNL